MKKLKGIKRLVNCGLITLVAFNLFVGCEQSNLFGPVEEGEYTSQELSPILFELDSRLSVDANGFHHITIDTTKWQTIHRISGHVYRVPIVNGASYSNEDGEVNTMIAPIKTMVGDTATIFYAYFDNWTYKETYGGFHIIFD